MKIALLNLPVDNNFGGNLQRYALIKTLEKMGHEVIFLYCHSSPHRVSFFTLLFRYLKRIIKKYLIYKKDTVIFEERNRTEKKQKNLRITRVFIEQNCKTSVPIYDKNELIKYLKENSYDAIVVGSDQVWRKRIAHEYGVSTYFLDFLKDNYSIKKIAFAASFGTDENELTSEEISQLGRLYTCFNAVSIRERSGIDLIKEYGWRNPKAWTLLDPTFMLKTCEYKQLIKKNKTKQSQGNMFCYILDPNDEKKSVASEEARRRNLKPFYASLNNTEDFSIYQWLRSFDDAKFVVTDSFHGVVFSIIFNKPFRLIKNPIRGNSRFESLCESLGINDDTENVNWQVVNNLIVANRHKSELFIKEALN